MKYSELIKIEKRSARLSLEGIQRRIGEIVDDMAFMSLGCTTGPAAIRMRELQWELGLLLSERDQRIVIVPVNSVDEWDEVMALDF